MSELTIIIDPVADAILLEEPGHVAPDILELLMERFGPGQEIACAVPLTMLPAPTVPPEEIASSVCVRISGYYHNSLIEGPGRRSTAKFQGCVTHCRGCIAQDTWNPAAGVAVPVARLAAALLDPHYERDGISLVGGEPFYQAEGLRALVSALRARGCPHILVYSGYTYERLQRMAEGEPAIGAVLREVDVLIDGPFVSAQADRGGPWTGSGNQRVINLVATRRAGHVVLLDGHSPGDPTDRYPQSRSGGDE